MVARKTYRSAAAARAGRLPDDRAVTALAALLLMLLAGAAQADQTEFVCRDTGDGKPDCESVASMAAACASIDQEQEFCAAVQSAGSETPYLLGNAKYTIVKPTRAGKEFWSRNKPRVMP